MRQRRHDLEAVRDVKQRLSRSVEAAEFSFPRSRRHCIVVPVRRGAAAQNLKLPIVIHDAFTMCPPDDSLAAVVTMRNFF